MNPILNWSAINAQLDAQLDAQLGALLVKMHLSIDSQQKLHVKMEIEYYTTLSHRSQVHNSSSVAITCFKTSTNECQISQNVANRRSSSSFVKKTIDIILEKKISSLES